jgi:Ala-tRNA(Pro) deacylase
MGVPATITNFLRANGIDFQIVTHAPTSSSSETAQRAHVPGDRLAKAVVLADGERYVLAVLPATHRVDTEELGKLLHRRIDLVDEDDFPMLFRDCRPGAVPPIGEAYGLLTIVDDAMTEPPDVYLEAEDHGRQSSITRRLLDLFETASAADQPRVSSVASEGQTAAKCSSRRAAQTQQTRPSGSTKTWTGIAAPASRPSATSQLDSASGIGEGAGRAAPRGGRRGTR